MALKRFVTTGGIRLRGNRELMRALAKLPERVERKVLLAAIRKVAMPIIQDARTRVPVKTGALKKALGVKTRKYRTGKKSAIAILGARSQKTRRPTATGKMVNNNPALYSHLVEGGTQPHTLPYITAGQGKVTAHYWQQSAEAKPFLLPAFEAGAKRGLGKLEHEIWMAIRKHAERLARG